MTKPLLCGTASSHLVGRWWRWLLVLLSVESLSFSPGYTFSNDAVLRPVCCLAATIIASYLWSTCAACHLHDVQVLSFFAWWALLRHRNTFLAMLMHAWCGSGEMICGPQAAFLMDSISTGLDTSTTFDIMQTLKVTRRLLLVYFH